MASSRRGSANSVQEARRASRFVSSTRSRRRGGIAFALAFGAIVLLAIGIWVVEGALYPHTASGTHMPSQNLRLLDRIPLRSSSWEKGAHDSYFAVLSTASSVLKRLWNKYDTMLESAPLLTNSLSTCLISVVGDLLAQFFETRKSRNIFHSVSVMRMLAVGLDGLVVSGPVTVLGHQLLEWLAPSHSSWLAAWFHMVVDETVLDAISLASFFVVTGLLEGRTLIKVLQQFREEFFCAFYGAKLSSLVLLPFTMFQFFGVSHKYRILAISLGDILWIASTFSKFEMEVRINQLTCSNEHRRASTAIGII